MRRWILHVDLDQFMVFAVPLQALSSVVGFMARDPAASTGMALQAAGWFAIGLGTYTGRPGQPDRRWDLSCWVPLPCCWFR